MYKWLLRITCFLVLLAVIGVATPRKWSKGQPTCERKVVFYVVGYGYHTSVVFENDSMLAHYFSIFTEEDEIRYVEFAWGDSVYFTSNEPTAWHAFRALAWPTSAVMHVRTGATHPSRYLSAKKVFRVQACHRHYVDMLRFIQNSFLYIPSTDQPWYLQKGWYHRSAFYRAGHRYHAFYTCNTWVADVLRKGQVNTPLWSGTAQALFWHLPGALKGM